MQEYIGKIGISNIKNVENLQNYDEKYNSNTIAIDKHMTIIFPLRVCFSLSL